MPKSLVIVESPAKAKSINKILGGDYVVKASMGHVRDLPSGKFGVDIEKGFKPQYEAIKGRQKVLTELKQAAKGADQIILAPDPDREGEAIAWHLAHELRGKVPEDKFYRVTYNEITASAIREAFSHLGRINQNRVDSQQARRILDRLVGYQVSPLLWRRIRGGSSAGRVQSVALRLVCEREREIGAFEPEEYWIVGARVRKETDPRDPFTVRLSRIDGDKADVKSEAEAMRVQADLEGRPFAVKAIQLKEVRKSPRPPFITSTLQQAASSALGFTPSRAMRIAQGLYEGVDLGSGPVGLITYMRTDSVNIAQQAQAAARAFISDRYGAEFIPEKPAHYRSRSGAQEAHEAIRPTDVTLTPEQMERHLKPEEFRLYRLIWERFVASQMAPARIAQRSVEVEASTADGARRYLFRASASDILFPGYMKVTGEDRKSAKAKEAAEAAGEAAEEPEERLPPLVEGEPLHRLDWLADQKFTQPPPRYSEASLVKALEEHGVGRPSTYASIISTLFDRNYIEKDKRTLAPTEAGRNVNDFLVSHLDALFDVKFTAGMEQALDEIEEGKVQWSEMLAKFYGQFQGWLKNAKGPDGDPEAIRALLGLLAEVKEWAPPVKRGKRTYNDADFVESVQKQLDDGKKAVSDRQVQALKSLVARYREQIAALDDQTIASLRLEEAIAEAAKPKEPPRQTTYRKLDLMRDVRFDEPRQVGKRVYDDRKFCDSLRAQVESGKRLSENQLRYMDQLVRKYADQIPSYQQEAEALGLVGGEAEEDKHSGPLLELLGQVSAWAAPVQRGKRVWDDQEFFQSLKRQFATKKALSPRQIASMKKLLARYAAQIPDYAARSKELELLPPRTAKGSPDEGERD